MPCNDGLEQPYIITILREVRSMSNSPGLLGAAAGFVRGARSRSASFLFSVGRGGFGDGLRGERGERGADQSLDVGAAFGVLNGERGSGAVAG